MDPGNIALPEIVQKMDGINQEKDQIELKPLHDHEINNCPGRNNAAMRRLQHCIGENNGPDNQDQQVNPISPATMPYYITHHEIKLRNDARRLRRHAQF